MSVYRSFAFTVLFTLWASTASAVQLFLINEFDANLYRVDTYALGTPELLGSVAFGSDVIELVTASANNLYAFDRDSNTLITLSTANASVMSAVSLDQDIQRSPRGFDLSPDGLLYGVLPGLELRTIDPTTGATSVVASLRGASQVESIAFAPDGTLYATGSPSTNFANHLYTIDISSGAMSLIGNIGQEIDTLTYARDGFLYGATSGKTSVFRSTLFQINPANAALSTVGDTGVISIVGITSPALEPFTFEPFIQDIAIDIKPGNDENPIKPRSKDTIKVAILTTHDFDASTVNASTVRFGAAVPVRYRLDDVDDDGDLDLLLKFNIQDTGIACGDTEATLTAQTSDGVQLGTGSIKTVGCKK